MEIAERAAGDVTILDLSGRFVLGEGDRPFRQKINVLILQGRLKFLVNFAEVTYMDSAGVGTLVWKYVTLRKQGGQMKLLHLARPAYQVLMISRLLSVMESFDTEEHALASFKRGQSPLP